MSKTKITTRRANFLAARTREHELQAARFAPAVRALVHKPQFIEEADGQRIRVWSDCSYDGSGRVIPSLDVVRDEDVRAWLLNMRATSIHEGLEFVHEKYVRGMIRDGYLCQDKNSKSLFWVTDKAAKRFNLPKVLGCEFPPAPTN